MKRGDFYDINYGSVRYVLPVNQFGVEVFVHESGLRYLPKNVLEGIAGRDVLGIGAYIGDSALVLNKHTPRRIYAVEPMAENIIMLKKAITINRVDNVVVWIRPSAKRGE